MKKEDFIGRQNSERNDCAVRAFVAVSGVSYPTVYEMFEKAGRKQNKGSHMATIDKVAKKLGFKRKTLPRKVSVSRLPGVVGNQKVVAIKRGHAFGFEAGKVLDFQPVTGRCLVWAIYEKIPEPVITYEYNAKGQYLLPL